MPILGCEKNRALSSQSEVDGGILDVSAQEARAPAEPAAMPRRPISATSLVEGSRLAELAGRLDQVAIEQSASLPEIQAAQAQLRALGFERYPQIRPTASAPLTDGSVSLNLNIEQLIWDGSRLRGRMTDAEIKVAEASLRAWAERNAAVYDGLEAYVDIARYQARLAALSGLKEELDAILLLLQTRAEGGVADRGELLRMNTALQSVDRRTVANRSSLRQAQTELPRLLAGARIPTSFSDIGTAANQCSRSWPDSEAPADALARVALSSAEVSEDIVRARRFPRVVLSGGSNYSQDGWSEPAIGIQLDTSDMLGFGRRNNVDAAIASTRAADASYALQRDETQADLAHLKAEYDGLRADATSLRALAQQSEAMLALYKEQLNAGSIPLTEGIVLHQERVDTLISLIDVEGDILMNCLRSSQRRGLLARFGVIGEDD